MSHAFDTHVYNLAGLEIAAEAVCREQLGLAALDWGAFYSEGKTLDKQEKMPYIHMQGDIYEKV